MAGRADSKLQRRRVPSVKRKRILQCRRKESAMSYDITIKRKDGKTVEFRHAHTITGGTYALGD